MRSETNFYFLCFVVAKLYHLRLRLLQHFGASKVYGINYSPEETAAAQRRVRSAGLSDRAVLRQGDAGSDLPASPS